MDVFLTKPGVPSSAFSPLSDATTLDGIERPRTGNVRRFSSFISEDHSSDAGSWHQFVSGYNSHPEESTGCCSV